MPFRGWTDKQTVVHPYNGIPLSNKREQIIDICNNLDDSQRHYAECKKPDTEDYILFYSIYMTVVDK